MCRFAPRKTGFLSFPLFYYCVGGKRGIRLVGVRLWLARARERESMNKPDGRTTNKHCDNGNTKEIEVQHAKKELLIKPRALLRGGEGERRWYIHHS